MDRLFTPWRRRYVTSKRKPDDCVFCAIRDGRCDTDDVLMRAQHWFVVLNRFPYTSGHILVVLERHVGVFSQLTAQEEAAYPPLLRRVESALQKVYEPDGINMGLNLGAAAGAGIDGHLHWHVLPRWVGDTNFLSVVGETRVLPETLEQTRERLRPFFGGE